MKEKTGRKKKQSRVFKLQKMFFCFQKNKFHAVDKHTYMHDL